MASHFVTVEGRKFVSPDGQPLLLRGINLGNWLLPEGYMFDFGKRANSPRLIDEVVCQLVGEEEARRFWRTFRERYITQEDVRFIKQAGFSHVRAPFNYRLFVTADEPRRLEGVGYEIMDRLIGWCREEGLYVILDMHGAPGGQTGANIDDSWGYPFLYDSAESQELTVRLWRALAERYSDEPIVIGYDLLNEPIASEHDVERLNPLLGPLYERIVAGIREVDRNHVVFLAGAQWNTNFDLFGPPFDDKLAYTPHRYWMDVEPSILDDLLDLSARHDVPLWVGETGENTDEWVAAMRALMEEHGVSWCFWTYKRLDTTRCVASIPRPAGWDAVAEFARHPRTTFEDVRTARPAGPAAAQALEEYLENLAFENCRINQGYLEALGLAQ